MNPFKYFFYNYIVRYNTQKNRDKVPLENRTCGKCGNVYVAKCDAIDPYTNKCWSRNSCPKCLNDFINNYEKIRKGK